MDRQDKILLVLPDLSWKEKALAYCRAYEKAGETHINGSSAMERFSTYEQWLEEIRRLQNIPLTESQTPSTTFFGVREEDGEIVGTIQVRHRLVGTLSVTGGNIGYGVRPEERRKGYAAQMLLAALEFCRKIGLRKVMLDCRADNVGSEKTILKCGGRFEGEYLVEDPDNGPEQVRRFWITL